MAAFFIKSIGGKSSRYQFAGISTRLGANREHREQHKADAGVSAPSRLAAAQRLHPGLCFRLVVYLVPGTRANRISTASIDGDKPTLRHEDSRLENRGPC